MGGIYFMLMKNSQKFPLQPTNQIYFIIIYK